MFQIFSESLAGATSSMLTVYAWLLAILGLLVSVIVLALILAAVFDAVTGLLRWFWIKTKHKPRGRIQRIIMGYVDDD